MGTLVPTGPTFGADINVVVVAFCLNVLVVKVKALVQDGVIGSCLRLVVVDGVSSVIASEPRRVASSSHIARYCQLVMPAARLRRGSLASGGVVPLALIWR